MVTAPVMPAEAAEWIRGHAWTGPMREIGREVPGFYAACACQSGLTHWCRTGRHGKCHRGTALPSSETAITDSGGCTLYFRRSAYRNVVRTNAIGPQRSREALVWLGDRVCRWVCPCTCHLVVGTQLDLFGPD